MRHLVIVLALLAVVPACADEPKDLLARARAALAKKDLAQARQFVDRAIAADPKSAAAVFMRGQIFVEEREFDKAIADFTQVLKLDPADAGGAGRAARLISSAATSRNRCKISMRTSPRSRPPPLPTGGAA